MLEAVLGFLGVVVGALLAFLGVRFSARSSAKAAQTTAAVQDRNVAVEEWRGIVADLRIEVDRLRGDVDTLKRDRDSDRLLIETLKTDRRALIVYVLELLAWGRVLAPAIPPPPPPSALADELTP
jgi:hypothetical protein